MEKQLRFGLANYILRYNTAGKELTENIRQYMCSKYGWVIKGGQKYFTSNHEKGSRDKNSEVESAETFEVGDFKGTERSPGRRLIPSAWLSEDEAREIPPPAFISGQDRL
jgi:hypothetical protein